jgi:hypothetical protein
MSTRGRIERAARKLQTYPAADRDHDAPVRLLVAAQDVGAAVIEGDWPAVRRASLNSLGMGLAAHGAIRRAMPDRISRTPLIAAQTLIHAFRNIARSPQREELVAGLRSHAESVGTEALERLAPSLDRLAEGRITGVPLLTELRRRESLTLPSYPEDQALAALTRGLLGLIHVEFNLALRHWRENADVLLEDDWNVVLQIELDEFRRDLRAREAGLQGALMSAPEAEATEAAALALFDRVQLRAPRFARIQAAAAQLAELLRDKGRGSEAEVIGARAAEAHECLREAVAAGVAAMHVSLELSRARALRIASAFADLPLVAQASTSSFDITIPDGKDMELSKLPDAEPDAFVDIGGFVETITVARPDGKLVSRMGLRDPSSGAAGEAAAIFTDLRHVGVTVGAYCRLSGHFNPSLNLLGGKPGVQIDRLEIATLAKASWRMALLKSAEPWFEPYRNGHNLRWSLGAHEAPPEAVPDSTAAGAAELIYLEAIRR